MMSHDENESEHRTVTQETEYQLEAQMIKLLWCDFLDIVKY